MLLALTSAVFAQPSAETVDSDRAQVERAAERLAAARADASRLEARVREVSSELDAILAEQATIRARLAARANIMYRTGDTTFFSVLLGAHDFRDFAARWTLLVRMSEQDAADLDRLERLSRDIEGTASALMTLQEEQARAVQAAEDELARARKELADSEAALAAYEAEIAEQEEAQRALAPESAPASEPPQDDPTQHLTGTGEWKTAVASHYGYSFTGRGANGETIGPYSMIVAHRTLPFGTLIEFEYRGKRAVARVTDRGPHVPGREFDLGPGVARTLGFVGVDEVRYRIIDK
ncbi:MAG: hypothetical protein Kow0056_11880 [Coriobacteriia bacterium]